MDLFRSLLKSTPPQNVRYTENVQADAFQFVRVGTKINRQHQQLALTIFTLVMLILGVGAPMDGGGVGR